MSNPGGFALRTIFIAVASIALMGQAHAGVSCHKIKAKGVGQDEGGGVTVARIMGGGLLQGTTEGVFWITGGAPPVFTVAGIVTFTTNYRATLPVSLAGTFNVLSGEFTTTGPVISAQATGKLSGAFGTLLLEGIQDVTQNSPTEGRFTEDISGVICVDLKP